MSGGACVANIGPRERRRRATFGAVFLALGGVAAGWLIATNQSPRVSVFVALPLFLGFIGVFQARAQTCIALAAQGLRNLDGGPERLDDLARAAVRRQARAVIWKSGLATGVALALVLVVA